MAHRAIDIKTSYFKSLFVVSALAFFNTGSASRHLPLDASEIPRSAALELLPGGAFGFACAFAAMPNNITAE